MEDFFHLLRSSSNSFFKLEVPVIQNFHLYNAVFNSIVVLLEVCDTDSHSSFTLEKSFSYPRLFVIPDEFEN